MCHHGVLGLSRLLFFLLGFLRIRVRGQRASRLQAPVLVAAPHSTFFDPIVLLPCDLPKVVSRAENLSVPVIGGEKLRGVKGRDGYSGQKKTGVRDSGENWSQIEKGEVRSHID